MIKFRKKSVAVTGAVAAIVLAGAAPVLANTYEDQVNALLNVAENFADSQGYSDTHNRYHGQLDEREYKTVTLNLDRGTEYLIVGQCDHDCSDMDLWLYDENGNEIDSDTLTDDTPIVRVSPIRSARFSLKTRIYACSVEPCYYGIGVYGR
ncbi:MAG: hypothetical protein ABJP48_00335 [Erythrobacter sp.]